MMRQRDALAVRIYRSTARLVLPVPFRREFGRQSVEAFADLLREAGRRGRWRSVLLLGREMLSLLRFGLGERYRPRLGEGRSPIVAGGDRDPDRRWLGAVVAADLLVDLRFALRLLLKEKAFAVTAVATLAIGVAATAAIFTIINGVLLRPLPYAEADRLAQVWTVNPPGDRDRETTTSVADYLALRAQSRALSDLGAHNLFFANVTGGLEAERIMGGQVTTNLFEVLGVVPALGAGFEAEHAVPGQDDVVVLSHGFWLRHFGGDRGVVGKDLMLDERPLRVLGVLPAGYRHPDPHRPLVETQVFTPFAWDGESQAQHGFRYLRLVGRLAPDVEFEEARAELNAIAERVALEFPETNKDLGATAVSFREQFFGELRPMLWLIQAAAVMVLLIVCANISNLVLVRGQRRQAEFAVRAALGAGRGRLARQIVVESAVLAAAGSGLGLTLVLVGQDALLGLGGRYLPLIADVRMDSTVVALAAIVAVIAAAVFALVGGAQLSSLGKQDGLRLEVSRSGGRVSRRVRGALVAAEIAFTVALVIAASLLARSLVALGSVPTGFDREGILTLEVAPPRGAYPGSTELSAYYAALGASLGAVPGVSALGFVSDLPFIAENRWTGFNFPDRPVPVEDAPSAEFRTIRGDYFRAMGIALVSGRGFGAQDVEGSPPRLVISLRMGEMFWAGEDPVGRGVLLGGGAGQEVFTIIGVVADVLDDGFASVPEPRMYFAGTRSPVRRMTAVLRTEGDPAVLAGPARAAVQAVDATVPITELQTLEHLVLGTLADERFATMLAVAFALVALFVAGLGIYGVMAYLVAARTREIGVRTALGARPTDVQRTVLRQALGLTSIGVGAGMALGFGVSRWLAQLLYEIAPTDTATFIAAPLVLGAVALIAGYVPARRASRVSPAAALRTE